MGAASLFTDAGSEMIAPIRILFLVLVLGAPIPVAGVIEGISETTASLFKIVSGRLADRVARRKPMIVFGYLLSNAVKPLLAFVTVWPQLLLLVFLDRVGKGVRGSPRDALLADSTEAAYRGKAFGFHRAMDTLGAALGPLLALFILSRATQDLRNPPTFLERLFGTGAMENLIGDLHTTEESLRQVFIWTALPGVLCVLVVVIFLREGRVRRSAPRPHAVAGSSPGAVPLGRPFWLFVGIATIFALGNASDAFVFLRAITLDAWLEALPLQYFLYNMVYAALATPLGIWSDRVGRAPILIGGYAAFGVVYAGWAMANQGWHTWVLFCVYGVYAAATDGVAKALVVDLVPKTSRGRALGWFNGVTGFAALPANVAAGVVWNRYGPGSTFALGATLAAVATLAMAITVVPRSFFDVAKRAAAPPETS